MSDQPVNLTVDMDQATQKQIDEWRSLTRFVVPGGQFDNALQRAVNRALDAARVKSKQVAKKGYAVNEERIVKSTFPHKAGGHRMQAVLEFRGRRIPIFMQGVQQYPGAQTSGGFQVLFKKGGGGLIESAYYGKVTGRQKDENKSVYIRKHRGPGSGKEGIPGTHGRLPAYKITGPAVVSMVGHEPEAAIIQARAADILGKRIDHEMGRLLKK